MKERPILMNGAMVRRTLDGSKTQTRRVVKGMALDWLQPGMFTPEYVSKNGPCPYGARDDRLWVRETFFAYGRWETRFNAKKLRDEWHFIDMTMQCDRAYQYVASQPEVPVVSSRHGGVTPAWWKRPAIHMPRWASRLTLEVTEVRVERLQDISDRDVDAEGFGGDHPENVLPEIFPRRDAGWGHLSIQECFARLWESINGAGSWDANPWVWVIEFQKVDDAIKGERT